LPGGKGRGVRLGGIGLLGDRAMGRGVWYSCRVCSGCCRAAVPAAKIDEPVPLSQSCTSAPWRTPMLRRKAQDAPPPLERRSRTMEILQQDVVSAIILLLAAVAALLLVNFGYAEPYEELLHFRLGVSLEQYSFVQTLHFWINEGLMAVFF